MWGSDVNNGNIFLEETSLFGIFGPRKNENSRDQHTLYISIYVCDSVNLCRNAPRLNF